MPLLPALLLLAAGLRRRLGGRLGGTARFAIHEGLEVRAGAELRHRGRGDLDRVTGRGVTGRASGPLALLEDAEASDGDLVATGHRRLDRVEDGVQRLGCRLLVPQPARDRVDQITLVHYSLLRSPREAAPGARLGLDPLPARN